MNIVITRTITNALYTEGVMSINGTKFARTVESTTSMLPAGTYIVELTYPSPHRLAAGIRPANGLPLGGRTYIKRGNSWKNCHNGSIVIGHRLMAGIIVGSQSYYERLMDRLAYAYERGEMTTLTIIDDDMRQVQPLQYWLEPNGHGCGPTNRRVVCDEVGCCRVYDGETYVKTVRTNY